MTTDTDLRSQTMRISRQLFHLDLAAGAVGLGLITLSLVVPGASAADQSADGSDWGAQGSLVSDSPQTASWDNTGNVAASVVPRDGTQVIPHTAGRTYADIGAADKAAYQTYFGAGNGLGGLQVSVSQTENLVNQGVAVTISGAKANIPAGGTASTSYFQVFQCWGALGADGAPDPDAASPDPATCEFGAAGPDAVNDPSEQRKVLGDPLVGGGDWVQYNNFLGEVPFLSIDGHQSASTISQKNVHFNHVTTNELDRVRVPASGTTTRQFEIQTGAESDGLGCGYRPDATSTPTCWLVVVPRIDNVHQADGAISPTLWAQRLQVKLAFQDVASSCATGNGQSLAVGSQMLSVAAASWIPGICSDTGVTFGASKLSDQVARQQYVAGASNAILTSDPVAGAPPSDVVPLALTAPVIALNWDYQPECSDGDLTVDEITTEAQAVTCGYQSLTALKADRAKAGQPVRDVRLDARLVAKMLTMSYSYSLIQNFSAPQPAWAGRLPAALTADPEFRRLNPQLHVNDFTGGISSMVLESGRSDAATHVWEWLTADPDARSFLSGCPDDDGHLVNPYFSTRTYDGCAAQAPALAAQSADERAHTVTPPGFVDQPQSYPPDGSPYPQPQWQEVPALTDSAGTVTQNPLTLTDWTPRVTDMSVTARDAFLGVQPRNDTWCSYAATQDPSCTPAPGKWKPSTARTALGVRAEFVITDAPSAARYQLPTASLCADAGTDCVGADTGSLEAAAADFQSTGTGGFQAPASTPDYAGGAYPMALPVYGVVKATLPAATRTAYADAFAYITTAGQVPGYESGKLPPGYAPLPTSLTGAAASGILALRKADPPSAAATGRPTSAATSRPTRKPTTSSSVSVGVTTSASPNPSATASADTTLGPVSSSGPGLSAAPSGGTSSDAASAVPAASPSASAATTTVQTMPVSASTETWRGWLFPLGVGLALGAGMAGPFLRRRTNVRLR